MKMKFDIVCMGNLTLDFRYLIDAYPEENNGSFITGSTIQIGGDAAIIANNLKILGVSKVALVPRSIGNDKYGKLLMNLLENLNIIYDVNSDSITTFSNVYVNKNNGTRTWFASGMSEHLSNDHLFKLNYLNESKLVYIESWYKNHALAAYRIAKSNNSTIILHADHKPMEEDLKYSNIIIRSNTDLKLDKDQIIKIINNDVSKYNTDLSIVTNGEVGCYYATKEGTFFIESFKMKTIDTTGAGATFASGVIYGLINNQPLKYLPIWGNALAALKIEVFGNISSPNQVARVFELIENSTFEIIKS